jgi:protein-S-isoprenylcysteine O-methyltransferase Ste14
MNLQDTEKKRTRLRSPDGSGEHPGGDLGQVICLAAFLAIWILDSFVFRFSTFLGGYVPTFVRLAAAGLAFAAAVYFVRAGHRVISRDSVRQTGLIKEAAFARVRHPLYLGSLLFYLGLVLMTFSLVSLATLGGIFVFYNFIASYEEKLLIREFGLEYRQYRAKVPKWLPRVRVGRFT